MPLDVMAAAKTTNKARKSLDKVIQFFLNVTAEMGTLQDILEKYGYIQSEDNGNK